ncbi:MAG: hypothetical protein KJ745_18040, partial [Gammaproteobacteria bacterium]|nr:hypothetical protein [Gammaproteobacteria bacterium]
MRGRDNPPRGDSRAAHHGTDKFHPDFLRASAGAGSRHAAVATSWTGTCVSFKTHSAQPPGDTPGTAARTGASMNAKDPLAPAFVASQAHVDEAAV